jgi:transposase
LILLLAEGATVAAIRERLETTNRTIIGWNDRFLAQGLEGLSTSHPAQKAYRLTPSLRAKVLNATRKKPSDGATHGSCRTLAEVLCISKDLVHRVWQEAGV